MDLMQSPAIDTTNQAAFFSWLSTHSSASPNSNISVIVDALNKYCVSRHLVSATIFEIDNKNTVERIYNRLNSDHLYKLTNRGKTDQMLTTLKQYLQFICENEQTMQQPAKENLPVDNGNDEAFRLFLVSERKSEWAVDEILKSLALVDELIAVIPNIDTPISKCASFSQASKVFSDLVRDPRFHQLNASHKNDHAGAAPAQIGMKTEAAEFSASMCYNILERGTLQSTVRGVARNSSAAKAV